MLKSQVICNVCGTVKGNTNHWWLIIDDGPIMSIEPLGIPSNEFPEAIHACSESCVCKEVSRYMKNVAMNRPE